MASAVLFIGWNRPHPGTDEIVLFGERAKLDELRRTDEFEAFSMKLAGMMTDFGVVPGVNWEGMQGVAKRGDPSAVVGGRRTGSR